MRARNIKPGFYKNDELACCSPWARLLAPGLWMMADRDGRLKDRPMMIKAEIFPFDALDVEPLLVELVKAKHITRYEVDGRQYIQINNFAQHQNPHIKEKQSVIPNKEPDKHNIITEQAEKGKEQAGLIPDSLIPESPPLPPKGDDDPNFAEFWLLFPKQRAGSKAKAQAAYRQALKRASHDAIMGGLKAYIVSDEATKEGGRFVKGCAAWLNDDRWACDYGKSSGEVHDVGSDEVSHKISRELYERCKRMLEENPYHLNKKGLQFQIDTYEKQNPREVEQSAPVHRQGNQPHADAR